MKKVKIISLSLISVVVLVVLVFNILSYRSLPELSGEIQSKQIKNDVTVYSDSYGVPHIYAESEEDAFYALGKMMASHRLFQMDLMRRIASGKLSEIIGPKVLKVDKLARTIQLRKTMEKFWNANKAKMDPKMITVVNSFLKGINDYIDNEPLPIEFFILRYQPKHFDIVDSMSISGYMALGFSEGLVGDTLFYDLAQEFGEEPVAELRISDREKPNSKGTVKKVVKVDNLLKDLVATTNLLNDHMFMFHGSNSWVMSGKRTVNGKPILANDPHIAFSNPSVWFEAHIDTPTFKMYGHFLPLIPFPVIGFNNDKAWAVTMSEIDDVDLYIEEFKDETKSEVKYKNEWVKTDKNIEIIKVKGEDDYKLETIITPHGPVLDHTFLKYDKRSIALKWSYYHPDNDTFTALYKMNKAKNCSAFSRPIALAAAPGINLSCVDSLGNIGWWVMGKIPIRNFPDSDILLDGSSGEYEYKGYYDFKDNPHSYNPDNGVIISTNFKPKDKRWAHLDGYWQPSERAERLSDILDNDKKFSLEEMKAIQNDNFTYAAKKIEKVLVSELEGYTPSVKHEKALSYLKEWDHISNIRSVGATIYHMTNFWVMKKMLIDELGEDRFIAFGKLADYWHFYKYVIDKEDSFWWDNKKTSKKESRQEIIRAAFDKSIDVLSSRFGPVVDKWLWGFQHTLEFVHPIGKVKPFNHIFNIGPYAADSAHYHVNNLSVKRYEDTFNVHLGPSTRRLIDMNDLNNTWGILPTGVSGQLKSEHYDDQTELYLQGKYRKQLYNKEDIISDSKKLILKAI